MNSFNKALQSKSSRGRVARQVAPHITSEKQLGKVESIFSKPSYTMPEIEYLMNLKNSSSIERSSKTS